jgi:F0F1-type ATP synthase assembly protein I
MPEDPLNRRDLGYYFAIGQVGLEMVVPIALGVAIDSYLGSTPWGTVVGAVLGLAGGLAHLITILNHQKESQRSPQEPRQDKP